MSGVLLRIIIYLMIICLPLILASITGHSHGKIAHDLGKYAALIGFTILFLQIFLAARIKWIERPFGLDRLLRYHKYTALLGLLLLLSHPLLLAAGGGGWRLLIGLDLPWYIYLGKITLVLLILTIGVSVYQKRLKLKFEKWRLGHDVFGVVILLFAFTHSWVTGGDLESNIMKTLWIVILGFTVSVFCFHRILRPTRLKSRPYRVVDVKPETENVWTVNLTPPDGEEIYPYLPGQFHFITFFRDRDLPVEEHHWTISSSPTEKDCISSTIKALGDFTSTMEKTRPGDKAAVHAAFGRFSYVLHPEDHDLVFIAGGIGITPLMSMLRHMRDTREERSVILLYANRSQDRIVFGQELAAMEEGPHPRLKVVHVLSHPEDDWPGETGHIDRDKIQRWGGNTLQEKAFYICGPPGLRKSVITNLKTLGVTGKKIRYEIFSLID